MCVWLMEIKTNKLQNQKILENAKCISYTCQQVMCTRVLQFIIVRNIQNNCQNQTENQKILEDLQKTNFAVNFTSYINT